MYVCFYILKVVNEFISLEVLLPSLHSEDHIEVSKKSKERLSTGVTEHFLGPHIRHRGFDNLFSDFDNCWT